MADSTSTAQLSANVLHTRAFEDSWKRLLEAAFPDPAQLRVVLDMVKYAIPASKVSVPDEEGFSAALHESLPRAQRLIFAALVLAPTEVRSRLWGLLSREPVGSLMGTIRLARYQRSTDTRSLQLSDYLGGYDYQDSGCTISELTISPIDHRTKRLPLDSISPALLSEVVADVITMVGSPTGDV